MEPHGWDSDIMAGLIDIAFALWKNVLEKGAITSVMRARDPGVLISCVI